MNTTLYIRSNESFDFDSFKSYLEMSNLVLDFMFQDQHDFSWCFHLEGQSTTLFYITYNQKDIYTVSIDPLACYADFKFFPYLVDSLVHYLDGTSNIQHIYQELDEDWIEETIANEIAHLKGTLSIFPRYYHKQPMHDNFVTLDVLADCGVNLHSSTPRIYGYLQYLLRNNLLPLSDGSDEINQADVEQAEQIVEVDIPQHEPIGRVKSWQLDGSETYETYSQEDVNQLISLSKAYGFGKELQGVVLNDIGTIHQEGIGMPVNGEAAIYWFTEAFKAGDALYAPTNLGDLYRKGCGTVSPNLQKAFEAYCLSKDPYAHYRIGQAYEEGWISESNLTEAMKWYRQAAEEGHHLAIKRITSASSKADNC